MGILIKNTGNTHPEQPYDRGGERNYQVIVCGEIVARFTHFRRDGLAICMEKAAQAVTAKNLPLKF